MFGNLRDLTREGYKSTERVFSSNENDGRCKWFVDERTKATRLFYIASFASYQPELKFKVILSCPRGRVAVRYYLCVL